MSHKTSLDMIEEIMEVSDLICSPWEIDFMESIKGYIERFGILTDKQRETLERIYQKACDSPY